MISHLKKQDQEKSNGLLPGDSSGCRLVWLDLAKGIGMALVLTGHAPREWMQESYPSIKFLFCFIYAFHMPFFFALSGMAYEYAAQRGRKKSCISYIKDKVHKLLIPWFCFAAILYLFFFLASLLPFAGRILSGSSFALIPVKDYVRLTILERNPYGEHIWYIYVLFIIQSIYRVYELAYEKTLGRWCGEAFGTALAVILSIIAYWAFWPVHHIADCVKTYAMYYLYGVLLARYAGDRTEKWVFPSAAAGLGLTCMYTAGLALEMVEAAWIRHLLFNVEVFFGIPLMILFLIAVSQILGKRGQHPLLRWLGLHSYSVYLLHQPFACGLLGIVLSSLLPHTYGWVLFTMAGCFLASIIFPVIVSGIGYYLGLGKVLKNLFQIEDLTCNILGGERRIKSGK